MLLPFICSLLSTDLMFVSAVWYPSLCLKAYKLCLPLVLVLAVGTWNPYLLLLLVLWRLEELLFLWVVPRLEPDFDCLWFEDEPGFKVVVLLLWTMLCLLEASEVLFLLRVRVCSLVLFESFWRFSLSWCSPRILAVTLDMVCLFKPLLA
jgi:hypothetical protein